MSHVEETFSRFDLITADRSKKLIPRLRKAAAISLSMIQLISISPNATYAHTYGHACVRPPTTGAEPASFIGFLKPVFAIGAVVLAELIARIGITDALEATETLIDGYYGDEPHQRLQAKYTFRQVIVWGIHHIAMSAEERMQLLTALSRLDGKISLLQGQRPPSKPPGKEPAQRALFHAEVFRASRLKLHGDPLPLRGKPDPSNAALINIPAGDEDIIWSGRAEDVAFWNRPDGGYDLYLRVTYKHKLIGFVAAYYLEVIEESAGASK
jgi:hypothetical protein